MEQNPQRSPGDPLCFLSNIVWFPKTALHEKDPCMSSCSGLPSRILRERAGHGPSLVKSPCQWNHRRKVAPGMLFFNWTPFAAGWALWRDLRPLQSCCGGGGGAWFGASTSALKDGFAHLLAWQIEGQGRGLFWRSPLLPGSCLLASFWELTLLGQGKPLPSSVNSWCAFRRPDRNIIRAGKEVAAWKGMTFICNSGWDLQFITDSFYKEPFSSEVRGLSSGNAINFSHIPIPWSYRESRHSSAVLIFFLM